MLTSSHLLGLAVSTAGGFGLNAVASRCLSHEPLHGFPRWRWYLSVCLQVVVFPPVVGLALAMNHGLSSKFLTLAWADYPDPTFALAYIYVLFGCAHCPGSLLCALRSMSCAMSFAPCFASHAMCCMPHAAMPCAACVGSVLPVRLHLCFVFACFVGAFGVTCCTTYHL